MSDFFTELAQILVKLGLVGENSSFLLSHAAIPYQNEECKRIYEDYKKRRLIIEENFALTLAGKGASEKVPIFCSCSTPYEVNFFNIGAKEGYRFSSRRQNSICFCGSWAAKFVEEPIELKKKVNPLNIT